jgi:alkylation response protein AidB-like acyl-CoA dehydrogenase
MITVEAFRAEARAWLTRHAQPRPVTSYRWGVGSESVALFQNMDAATERRHIDRYRDWVRLKSDHGFANVDWATQWGGRGLTPAHQRAFEEEECGFIVPPAHESVGITCGLVAPTINVHGTPRQRERFLRRMLRTDDMWCQLFSEPAAGSDLAGVVTRAERDGEEWVLNGQKVWTSGAQYADWGYALCRTDPSVPKHRGLTAFIVPMAADGVEIRPLRQATGGSSFNEVFFRDVRIPDDLRLGEVGQGWQVALTTLGFERSTAAGENIHEQANRLVMLARHLDRAGDPVVRDLLARVAIQDRILLATQRRVKAQLSAGATPGPEGSLGKLMWTEGLRLVNEAAAEILGPRLVADSGEWGTFAWSEHLLGTTGYRIAGGTDEIQRNIISERILQLPPEPRVDKDRPFRESGLSQS